jgi:hypothetical protein
MCKVTANHDYVPAPLSALASAVACSMRANTVEERNGVGPSMSTDEWGEIAANRGEERKIMMVSVHCF